MITRATQPTLRIADLLALLLIPTLGGCPFAQGPREIPADIGVVLGDPQRFAANLQESTDPAGTPVTSLDQLAGCWGTSSQWLGVAQVLHFDLASGELQRTIYQDFPPFIPPFIDRQRGTLRLDSPGTATYAVSAVDSTLRTGRLTPVSFDELPRYQVTLQISDSTLLANFSEIDTPRESGGFADRVTLRHQAFDCP